MRQADRKEKSYPDASGRSTKSAFAEASSFVVYRMPRGKTTEDRPADKSSTGHLMVETNSNSRNFNDQNKAPKMAPVRDGYRKASSTVLGTPYGGHLP